MYMTALMFLLSILLFLAVDNVRSCNDKKKDDEFVYPLIPRPHFESRNYERDRLDLLAKMVRLLEDISYYIRRPQQAQVAPQPIYIPYPMPYLQTQPSPSATTVPSYIGLRGKEDVSLLSFSRYPEIEDSNQNWGIIVNKEDKEAEDGSRPNSFQAIKPDQPLSRPVLDVDRGSVQLDGNFTTEAPTLENLPANQNPRNVSSIDDKQPL